MYFVNEFSSRVHCVMMTRLSEVGRQFVEISCPELVCFIDLIFLSLKPSVVVIFFHYVSGYVKKGFLFESIEITMDNKLNFYNLFFLKYLYFTAVI